MHADQTDFLTFGLVCTQFCWCYKMKTVLKTMLLLGPGISVRISNCTLQGTPCPRSSCDFFFQLFIIRVKPIGESWVISREKGMGKGICKQEELILFLDCLWCSVVMQPTSIYLLSACSLDGWEHVFPSKGLLTCSVKSKTTDLQCFTVSMVTISRLPLSDLRKCASC